MVVAILLAMFASACTSVRDLAPGRSLSLTSFTENSVEVSFSLTRDSGGTVFLAATFTPPTGFHMYSKDLPRDGVDGLGRPTLLELPTDSKIKAIGPLFESVPSSMETFETLQLSIYPEGAVTLSLPIELPAGSDWVDDTVSVTYMACNENGCKPPVIGKLVVMRVPGDGLLSE